MNQNARPDSDIASQTSTPAGTSSDEAAPYVAPPPQGPRWEVRALTWSAPWRWLRAGAADLRAEPGIALFYGLCFWAMSQILEAVFHHAPEYTMSIISGCLLVGPFLTMGLYEVSRRRERGEPADLASSLTCWDRSIGSMGMLVLVLVVLELLWGRASLVVFAVFFNTGMPSTTGVIRAIFNPENWEFIAIYLAVGGAFAGLVFATSVVSIPMILDRNADAISASLASVQVFFANLGVLLLWGAIIAVCVVLAFWPWGLGLIVVVPWLGHATWHAYRASLRCFDRPDAST